MPDFTKIAPYLGNPLVLAGFGIFLAVGVLRLVLGLRIFAALNGENTRALLGQVIRYAFILAVLTLAGGFGFATYQAFLNSHSTSGPASSPAAIAPLTEPKSIPAPQQAAPPGAEANTAQARPAHGQRTAAPHAARPAPAPRVSRIVEGHSDSGQRRIFDITLENPLDRQITLDTFEANWQYSRGALAAVEQGEAITAGTKHSILLKIDLHDSGIRRASIPVQPTIVLPAADPAHPAVYVLRLELLYDFDHAPKEHASTDWNITFSVSIRTTDGATLPVFQNASWR